MNSKAQPATGNRYKKIVEKIFFDRFSDGSAEMLWERRDLELAAETLGIDLPKNLGDVIYAMRYRIPMPDSVIRVQPEGMEWIIEGAGRARYKFQLVKLNRIVPNAALATIGIPDATPEIIRTYALDDEQALLAIAASCSKLTTLKNSFSS